MPLSLSYKRGLLVSMGIVLIAVGLVAFLLRLAPFEGRRGIIRLMVSILGPEGIQTLLATVSLLLILGGLRYFWLALGGLAAEIRARGILVRSTYYSGLIPWAAVRGIDTRPLPGWGETPIIFIERNDRVGPLLSLIGLGNKVAVQCKLLDADEDAIEAWIESARNRGQPLRPDDNARDIAASRAEFGRRRSQYS